MNTTRVPRARPDVVIRRLADDEWALFDPKTSRIHAINLSAALVFEHCDGVLTEDDLAEVVKGAFGSAPETVKTDVQDALERFTREGLVTWT